MLRVEWAADQQIAGDRGHDAGPGPESLASCRARARRRRSSDAERKLNLAATELLPTDGLVKETAEDIVKGKKDDVAKARALYEWVVDNTFRNPKTLGCGVGDITPMIETGNLNGKCADLNALYVGLARSVGLPARDVYGIRVVPSQFGYQGAGRGLGERHQGAALPRRGLARRQRLDAGRSGRRAQGRARGAAGAISP